MNDSVLEQIKRVAEKYMATKVVLYGSRARGDHSPHSDYDIAIFANQLNPQEKAMMYADIEEIDTLSKIDLVFCDDVTERAFFQTIIREGIVIYEAAE